MEGIYQWIRSLVFYLILMTMLMNLLPDKNMKIISGCLRGLCSSSCFFSRLPDFWGRRSGSPGYLNA